MFEEIIAFIRELYATNGTIALHEPRFIGKEKEYLCDVVDSTFVSSLGPYVDRLENEIKKYVGSKYVVAMINGTAALHVALTVAGVAPNDEVITQPVTFVATANAISYARAIPVFVDVERETLGLDPVALEDFLLHNAVQKDNGYSYNKRTNRRIRACIPVHVLGHPVRIEAIRKICEAYNIVLIEDAAEALGSLYKDRHIGTFGDLGVYSFNGNKIITGGCGGVLVTNNEMFAAKARHISTVAKCEPAWRCFHDCVGYNYKFSNLNAALVCAQLENFSFFIKNKRETAELYKTFFEKMGIESICEPKDARSNYWLNAILLDCERDKNDFIAFAHMCGVHVRPLWYVLHRLPMYNECDRASLHTSDWLAERLVTLPSSVRIV